MTRSRAPLRRATWAALALLTAATLAACRREATPDAGAAPPASPPSPPLAPPSATPTPVVAPRAAETSSQARSSTLAAVWTPTELREPTNATTSPDLPAQRAMFADDCHAVPWRVVDDETSSTGLARRDVCRADGFDQNCAPDWFGCWEGRVGCRAACGSSCVDCESSCGGACVDCRAACAPDDDACRAACGVARADCFEACAQALDRCKDETCAEAYTSCEARGEADRRRICGKTCEKLAACLESSDYERCRARFPKADPRCFEWCLPS
jgi:hypothetical protein